MPHQIGAFVLVSGLKNATDAQVKRDCIETLGSRPRFVYMHVSDLKTGVFSGTCIVEFVDVDSARKAVSNSILGCKPRSITDAEFDSLTSGDWPMVEYGPPQGVFSANHQPTPQQVQATRVWAQPADRPAPTNPWQK